MKKSLSYLGIWVICMSGAYAMDDGSLLPSSSAKKTMRRINSEANMLLFEEGSNLPHMSCSEYMSMMEKFLADNSNFLDFNDWISQLKSNIKIVDEPLAKLMERFPKIRKPDDNKIDISCSKIVESAMDRLTAVEAKKPDIMADTALTMENLKWILENFDEHLKNIQAHENMPVMNYSKDTAPYDSGLSDSDIDLLINLAIGEKRLFRVSELSEDERREFIDVEIKPMLRNATGFQLVVSILNQTDGIEDDHIETKHLKGSEGSYKQGNVVNINKADDFSSDMSLFHETRHIFHSMLGLKLGVDELISNVSIINSDNINLIDQFFPILRPSVMLDTVAEIQKFITDCWGLNFENIDQTAKEKLIVLFLEPTLRNIIVSGFGSLVPYCKDWNTKSLTVTTDALTPENIAWCIYLSFVLNKYISNPVINLDPIVTKDGDILIPTNKEAKLNQNIHPVFGDLHISSKIITEKIPADSIFGRDSLWNTTEEKLCIQGSTLYQTSDGYSYYLQDKQNEHIYLIRSGKHDPSVPISYRYRFHQKQDLYTTFSDVFKLIGQCVSPSDEDWYQKIKELSIFSKFEGEIYVNFLPSLEEKYSTDEKASHCFKDTPIDEESFKKFENAMDMSILYQKPERYEEDVSLIEDLDNFVIQKVQDLIDQGLPVNVKNDWGETPLSLASNMNFPKTRELLIQHGAIENYEEIVKSNNDKANNSDGNGGSSELLEKDSITLDEEAYEKWDDALNSFQNDEILSKRCLDDKVKRIKHYDGLAKQEVESLIKQGLSVNIKSKDRGWTPLFLAFDQYFLETARLLINSGVDINAHDINDNAILHSLYQLDDFNLVNDAIQLLVQNGADINEKDRNGKTLLSCAIDSGYPNGAFINALIENGADVNALDHNGNTLVHIAVRNSCAKTIDILKLLIDKNIDINALNHKGETPLFELFFNYYGEGIDLRTQILEFMLDHGAKLDIRNNEGNTILHTIINNKMSFSNDIEKFIECLLKHGTDINCINYAGNTPLHLAVKSYGLDAVKFLLGNKAAANIKNYDGFTPVELAIKRFWNNAVESFINNININSNDAIDIFHAAVKEGNISVIKILESKGFDINKQYSGFNTLELAIEHNANEIAKLFSLDDVDVASPYAEKLFRLAAANGNLDVVKTFADKGINVNTVDENGDTAAHLAVSNCVNALKNSQQQNLQEITLEILKIIKQAGGDLNKANNQGIMPIQLVLLSEDVFARLVASS